jgi:L-threonylcarbamoyladenylate synthase
MLRISIDQFLQRDREFFELLHDDGVMIYPTDTIYGIGCDAFSSSAVAKIRQLKQRPTQPFSIIAPSKEWITTHFEVPTEVVVTPEIILRGTLVDHLLQNTIHPLDLLPGPYTLILTPKDTFSIGNISDTHSIGVRIPNHTIAGFVSFYGSPIITTSVNIHTQPALTSFIDMNTANMVDFKDQVGLFVDDGEISGRESTIIDVSQK